MAWYNNLGDFVGDIKDIATGHNPMNNPTPVAAPPKGSGLPVAGSPTPGTHSTGSTVMASGGTGWIDPDTGADVPAGTPGAIPADSGGSGSGGDSGSGSSGGGLLGTAQAVGGDILDFVKKYGGDVAGAISDYAKKYGTTALEAYNIYQAAQRQAQSNQYAQSAISGEQGLFDAKSGLRSSGISGLMNPGATVPNLSHLQSLAGAQSGNPFARGGALPVAGSPAPAGPPGRLISAGPVDRPSTPPQAVPPLSLQPQGTLKGVLDGTQNTAPGTLPVAPGANLPPGAGALATGTVKPRTIPFAAPTDRPMTDDVGYPPRIMS